MKLLTNLQDYRKYPALHYSMLSALDKSPRSLVGEEKEFSDAMKMGAIVDTLLTNPEDFDKLFYIVTENKPTGHSLKLVEEAIQRCDSYDEQSIEETLYKIRNDLGLWSNIVNPKLLKSKIKDASVITAIKEHFAMQGKTPIYADEKVKVEQLLEVLRNHNFTKRFFDKTDTQEILHQVPIVFTNSKGINYKGLLDGLIIDKWNKKLIPYDLKTSDESVFQFPHKVFRWRYDIQAAIYSEAVKQYRDSLYPDFEISDFLFVVGSFTSPERPLVYNSRKIIDIGTNGGKIHGYYYKGYKQLTEEYFWHKEHNLWEYRKEVYDSGGVIDLDYNEE